MVFQYKRCYDYRFYPIFIGHNNIVIICADKPGVNPPIWCNTLTIIINKNSIF